MSTTSRTHRVRRWAAAVACILVVATMLPGAASGNPSSGSAAPASVPAFPSDATLANCTSVPSRPSGTLLDNSYTSNVWTSALTQNTCADRGYVQQFPGTPGSGPQQDGYVKDMVTVGADRTTFDASTDIATPPNVTLSYDFTGGDITIPGLNWTPTFGSADWRSDTFFGFPDNMRYRYRTPAGSWGAWQSSFPPVRLAAQGADCTPPGTVQQGPYTVDYFELGNPTCTYKMTIADPVNDPNHNWNVRDLEVAVNIPWSARNAAPANVSPNGHLQGFQGALLSAGAPVLLYVKGLGSQPPNPLFTATPGAGADTVDLDASASTAAPLRTITGYEWTYYDSGFNEIGTAAGVTTTKTFATPGPWYAALKLTDSRGETKTLFKTLGDGLQASATALDPHLPSIADSTIRATFTATNTGITPITDITTTFGATPDGVVGVPTNTVAPFSLAPGASEEVTAEIPVHGPGEGFATVQFQGTGRYGPVDTGQTSLPFDVAGGSLASTLEVTQLIREGAGGSAQITAHVLNDSGSDVTGLQADLQATPSDAASILQLSGPTALADGQSGDYVFDVQITSTDVIDLQFDVQGLRTSDNALIAAPPTVVSVALSAPLIQSVVAERSGGAAGTAKGGERVVVTGLNLQDVVQADFELGGGVRVTADQLLVTSDTEIEFVTPKMVSDLQEDANGDLLVDTNLILRGVTGLPAPADVAESNPAPFRFEGPVVEFIGAPATNGPGGGSSGNALGNEDVVITGRNFTDVTGAVFRDAGGQQVPADITVTDDGHAVIKTPDATSFLSAASSGQKSWSSLLSVFWQENLPAPYDEVASGAVPFEFEGPVVTSLEVAGSGLTSGDVRGGERVAVTGRNLGAVTDASFTFTNGPAVPASDIVHTGDDVLEFTTPYVASYLEQQSDGSTAVDAKVILSYETANPSPNDIVTSGRTPFRFEGPRIDSRSSDTVSAKGARITVEGRNFDVVATVAFSVEGALIEKRIDSSNATTVTFTTPDMTQYLRTLPDGTRTVSGKLYLTYPDPAAPDGEVMSNWVDITFTAPVQTTVTQFAPAGSTEVQVASNAGWGAGTYGQLGPDGPVREVAALGSLIFAAPTPIDLPVGTVITKVAAPNDDTTAPVISVEPASGTFAIGERVTVDYSCSDAGVGVESCSGTVASGAFLDTSTSGPHEITVHAWDGNGNASSRTVTYTVSDAADGSTTTSATPAGQTGTLPQTGADLAWLAAVAACCLAAGLALVGASRRARRVRS